MLLMMVARTGQVSRAEDLDPHLQDFEGPFYHTNTTGNIEITVIIKNY